MNEKGSKQQDLDKPEMAKVLDELIDLNNRMDEKCCSIENKLQNFHCINLKDDKIPAVSEEPVPASVMDYLNREIRRISFINNRLETIYSHLNKIL